jgi:hypothetical protein
VKNEPEIIWIDGKAYSKNCKEAIAYRKSLAGLDSPESKQNEPSHPLDRNISATPASPQSPGRFRILIVRYGRKRLGSDVLPFAYKSLRDELAMRLLGGTIGQLDDDPCLEWQYGQIISKTTGTHVLISHDQQTKGQTGTKGI